MYICSSSQLVVAIKLKASWLGGKYLSCTPDASKHFLFEHHSPLLHCKSQSLGKFHGPEQNIYIFKTYEARIDLKELRVETLMLFLFLMDTSAFFLFFFNSVTAVRRKWDKGFRGSHGLKNRKLHFYSHAVPCFLPQYGILPL